jgi:O-antigen/teichoic acid export membrane protein
VSAVTDRPGTGEFDAVADDAAKPNPGVTRSYARNARLLTAAIGTTGLMTAGYFVVASHVLVEVSAKRIDLVWSIMWVIISVIYRPIEQLLSRTIADRRARGLGSHPLQAAVTLQGTFALIFVALALAFHHVLRYQVLDGSGVLFWVLVFGVLFYAMSYFARGWLAGHQHFGLYGGLVMLESASRLLFAGVVAVGITHGQSAVAIGIAAAPFVSLVVVPLAFARRGENPRDPEGAQVRNSARESTGFAMSVAAIMLAEQALLNASVITVDATAANAALAGIVFNVLLIARAPLQLFQAIQTSLLPHLAKLEATEGHADFKRLIRNVVLVIAGLTVCVALGLLAIGPFVMAHVFGQHFEYGRIGLAAVGLGMGFHLVAGTLNQAALARGQARFSSAAWLVAAGLFLVWTVLPIVPDALVRVEIGYCAATALLCGFQYALFRAGESTRAHGAVPAAA